MTDPNQGSISIAASSEEFDRVVLGAEGADIEAVAQAIQDGINPDGKQDDKDAEATAKADAEAKAKEEAEAKAKADADAAAKDKADADAAASSGKDTKVEGVLLKDGKHVAPYAVLEDARGRAQSEREARERAEDRAKELQAELDRLKSGKTDDPAKAEALSADLSQMIETLTDAAPELGEALDPLIKHVQALTEQVRGFDDVKQRQQRQDAEAQSAIQREVQEAIDANPKLIYAQSKDQATWNRIADQDAVLRADPANRGLSFADRFSKAVAAVEAVYGEIKLPPEFQTKAQPDAGKDDAKAKAEADAKAKAEADAKAKAGLTNDDAKARAEAELEKAKKDADGKPFTLTDLPGGAPPISDDKATAEMTPGEIAARVDRFLEKGGSVQDITSLF